MFQLAIMRNKQDDVGNSTFALSCVFKHNATCNMPLMSLAQHTDTIPQVHLYGSSSHNVKVKEAWQMYQQVLSSIMNAGFGVNTPDFSMPLMHSL
jgi:hypothetical protein